MKHTVTDIFFMVLAMLLGAFVGLTFAFAITATVSFLVSAIAMIIGAAVGYFAYDWQQVKEAGRMAYKKVLAVDVEAWNQAWKVRGEKIKSALRPDWPQISGAMWVVAAVALIQIYIGTGLFYSFEPEGIVKLAQSQGSIIVTSVLFLIYMFAVNTILLLLCASRAASRDIVQVSKWCLKNLNPIMLLVWSVVGIFWSLIGIAYALVESAIFVWRARVKIWKFVRLVLQEIHRKRRLIVAISAALAVGFGCWLGHDFVTCLAYGLPIGLVCLLVQYYLVAVAWLKLEPA